MLMLLLSPSFAYIKRINWTTASKEESNPLSQWLKKQGQPSLFVKKVTAESPNPVATAKKIAETMDTKPHVLKNMPEHNTSDMAGISMVTGRATTKGKAVRRQKERGIRHGMWRIFAVVKDTDITIASVDHFL